MALKRIWMTYTNVAAHKMAGFRNGERSESRAATVAKVQALCDYWRDEYDWRRCETLPNRLGQYRTKIDGLGLHFLHARSPEADALPLLTEQERENATTTEEKKWPRCSVMTISSGDISSVKTRGRSGRPRSLDLCRFSPYAEAQRNLKRFAGLKLQKTRGDLEHHTPLAP